MRELKTSEVEAVSGAGLFSDFGLNLGTQIGELVNVFVSKGNEYVDRYATAGEKIGAIIDTSVGLFKDVFSTLFPKAK